MTEAEWLAYDNPEPMLRFLEGRASDRKLRLFACACCRQIWPLLTDGRSRRAVAVAEEHADGRPAAADMTTATAGGRDARAARRQADLRQSMPDDAEGAAETVTLPDPRVAAHLAADRCAGAAGKPGARRDQCRLIRDLFGTLLFRPVAISPGWVAANDGPVVRVAQRIYEGRAFDRLPELAKVLEAVGCSNAELLAHCRAPGEHARGCWALDLLLGMC